LLTILTPEKVNEVTLTRTKEELSLTIYITAKAQEVTRIKEALQVSRVSKKTALQLPFKVQKKEFQLSFTIHTPEKAEVTLTRVQTRWFSFTNIQIQPLLFTFVIQTKELYKTEVTERARGDTCTSFRFQVESIKATGVIRLK
jgi:hypothetical protein